MKALYACFLPVLVALLVLTGCDTECEECPTCPDTNLTNVDPPFIRSVTGPGEIAIGDECSYSCEVLSDADIVRISWNLAPGSGGNADYFYPGDPLEGPWTPQGERPLPFAQTDSGDAPVHTYEHRGLYTSVVEIEDEDGYIERLGTLVEAVPATVEPYDTHVVWEAVYDTIDAGDFDIADMRLFSSYNIPAAVYTDGFDLLHCFAHTSSEYNPTPSITHCRVRSGIHLGISGAAWITGDVTVDFDVAGALHLWGGNPDDLVEYTAFIDVHRVGDPSEIHELYTYRIDGSGGDQSYYLDSHHTINDTVMFLGDELYELWFGIETIQYHSAGDSTGSAVCFDGDDGQTLLNWILVYLYKG